VLQQFRDWTKALGFVNFSSSLRLKMRLRCPEPNPAVGKFVNGEFIENQDVAVCYCTHFRHEIRQPGSADCGAFGPTPRLVR
jgi:hypothetical protein